MAGRVKLNIILGLALLYRRNKLYTSLTWRKISEFFAYM